MTFNPSLTLRDQTSIRQAFDRIMTRCERSSPAWRSAAWASSLPLYRSNGLSPVFVDDPGVRTDRSGGWSSSTPRSAPTTSPRSAPRSSGGRSFAVDRRLPSPPGRDRQPESRRDALARQGAARAAVPLRGGRAAGDRGRRRARRTLQLPARAAAALHLPAVRAAEDRRRRVPGDPHHGRSARARRPGARALQDRESRFRARPGSSRSRT